jgi:hypothetical protein
MVVPFFQSQRQAVGLAARLFNAAMAGAADLKLGTTAALAP